MTPEQFIATWKNNPLTERAGAQAHFDDLCDLLGVPKPRDPDNYCFERGAKKTGGGDGWADVWKRGHFGWENKKPGRDLNAALKQLTDYALQLDNPPLLVVCDRERIVIHTAFTGYPDEPREIRIDELADPHKRQWLRWVFTDPLKLRPEKSNAAITAEAAGRFAQMADAMRRRGLDGQAVAHFLVQCLFCMFAEDEQLLPDSIFTNLLTNVRSDPAKATRRIEKLFIAMQKRGGEYGDFDIPWFNGGLFKTIAVPALTLADVQALHQSSAGMDWRAIDPTIFGTLFERGLDPAARAPLGAHYTDTSTIAKLITPLVTEPLSREWQAVYAQMAELAPKFSTLAARGKGKTRPNDALKKAQELFYAFLQRLNQFRVLDPACGSGNFLYLALEALRNIEKRAHLEATELGLPAELTMQTGPHNILGLEINEFAAELARVTVWIGDIQWCRRNGYPHAIDPILKPLDGIAHRDALLNPDGTESAWPAADVIVGNPPFLGGSRKRSELGDAYFDALNKVYADHVPGGADLVCYWFHKARQQIQAGQLQAAGLVSTQSIRAGSNRKVLEAIVAETRIFEAWSDEPWINDGAAVRVSLVGFGPLPGADRPSQLDGQSVVAIYADLTGGNADCIDLTKVRTLAENANTVFLGTKKSGAFDISGDLARSWLSLPNPHSKPNSQVVRPWANGQDLVGRPLDKWIIDFGTDTSEVDASYFQEPFDYVVREIKPEREKNNRPVRAKYWWRLAETMPAMRKAVANLTRYITTARVAKHRTFIWRDVSVLPDDRLAIIARADDTTFGILSSRMHEVWSLANASMHGDGDEGGRPTYNAKSCFETFPFPAGLTPRDTQGWGSDGPPAGAVEHAHAQQIAQAARHLHQLRDKWLNPPEWVEWVITPQEEQAGFPRRPVAKPGFEADLKKRTLTNLYNARPAWLTMAHQALDKAVAAAYGWPDYTPAMPDDDILKRLLALNLERSHAAAPKA